MKCLKSLPRWSNHLRLSTSSLNLTQLRTNEQTLTRASHVVAQRNNNFLSAIPTIISKTKLGTRVATEASAGGETASVGVWIDAGSRYETKQNNGAAHFLEHMAFKGTSRRTRMQLEMEIENIGGHLNAYTSREQTVYYAKVFKKDVEQAMDILADILINSLLRHEAIEQERGVILREMEEVNKQYEELMLDLLHSVCFQGTGLGWTILGPEENIRKLKREDLADYIDTHYTADRFVIAGAGAIDHHQLVDLTEKYFGKLPLVPKTGRSTQFDAAKFTGSEYREHYSSMTEAHIALAFEGASWTSEFAFPMMVIQGIIGNWDRSSPVARINASRLAQEMTNTGLVQSYMSFNTAYKDSGLFGIYLVVPEESLDRQQEVMHVTLKHLMRLCEDVTPDEVERAKTLLKAQMLNQLDSFSLTLEDIGRQMLTYGRRMSAAETFARIDALTVDDIKVTANRFFNDENHALAAYGPIKSLPSYEWIREHCRQSKYSF